MATSKGSEAKRKAEREAKAKAKEAAKLAELSESTPEERLRARTDVTHDADELAEREARGEFS